MITEDEDKDNQKCLDIIMWCCLLPPTMAGLGSGSVPHLLMTHTAQRPVLASRHGGTPSAALVVGLVVTKYLPQQLLPQMKSEFLQYLQR